MKYPPIGIILNILSIYGLWYYGSFDGERWVDESGKILGELTEVKERDYLK